MGEMCHWLKQDLNMDDYRAVVLNLGSAGVKNPKTFLRSLWEICIIFYFSNYEGFGERTEEARRIQYLQ